MTFNPEIQSSHNGPWTSSFRKRVEKVKDALGYSLADIGATFGFSGSFVHGLMNGKKGYNMATKHAARVLQALQGLEVQAGLATVAPSSAAPANAKPDLGDLIKAIHTLGFSVELKPLAHG